MRRIATLLLLALSGAIHADTLTFEGFLSARGVHASGPESWLRGGNGRFPAIGTAGLATAQLGADWTPSPHFGAHVHGLARHEPAGSGGRRAGLVEGYVDLRAGRWTVRAGQFFLGTSRENIDVLWNSPYAASFSAANSWIAEEFRPAGIDAAYHVNMLTVAVTAFRNNDTAGTLIAWRGWDTGNRLSLIGEKLPLRPPAEFVLQKPGTLPFENDLDGRAGFAARVRFALPERGSVQITHADNRGDRELHGDEYAWQTRFDIAAAEIGNPDATIAAAEYLRGTTGMGRAPKPFVQTDFSTAYFLVSHAAGKNRFTARYELFSALDRAHVITGMADEHGRAWTLAWLHDVTPHLRAAAEFTQITGRRAGAFDGRALTLDFRYWLHHAW